MRMLLVNPYYPIDETPSPPLGLAFIAGSLETAGHTVKMLDFVVFPYSEESLKKALDDFSPDALGVTSVTMSFDSAIQVVQKAKQFNPALVTLMGGPHVTFIAEETLSQYPELDCIILGEGDETVVEWAEVLKDRWKWPNVKGLAFRDDFGFVTTGPRPPVDVNALSLPARHLIPLGRYKALGMAISMTTSRGCPFQCIFCVGRKMVGAKVRYRNPVDVVDEMALLQSLGFHQINLADDLFTANKAHCHAVCDEILKRGLKLSWTSFARVDTVSEEVLVKMKASGCHTVSFGIESGNPEMLKRIRKGITLDQVTDAVGMCNRAGITPHASFILGLPGETPETLKDSIEFGDRLSKMGVLHGFHILAPFPGAEVRDQIDRYDLKILSMDWSTYHANRAIVETATVSRDRLDEVVIHWEKKYNDYLGELKVLRENGMGTAEQVWPLTRLEHTVLMYDLMMGRVIEELGPFTLPEGADSRRDALDHLVKKITGSIKATEEELKRSLGFAMEQGYLSPIKSNGMIRWQWADYLENP
jgi:anaerobic magnesium-protoporphyrin IX monomethyl ester cyclase